MNALVDAARRDRNLRSGIVTIHIGRRISLSKAEVLSGFKDLVESEPLRRHLVQNVIRGAIEDALNRSHRISSERLANGIDNGNRPGHGRLVVDVHIFLFGEVVDLRPVLCQQCLVARDHRGARAQSMKHQLTRRFNTTDKLNNDVRLLDERLRIRRQ